MVTPAGGVKPCHTLPVSASSSRVCFCLLVGSYCGSISLQTDRQNLWDCTGPKNTWYKNLSKFNVIYLHLPQLPKQIGIPLPYTWTFLSRCQMIANLGINSIGTSDKGYNKNLYVCIHIYGNSLGYMNSLATIIHTCLTCLLWFDHWLNSLQLQLWVCLFRPLSNQQQPLKLTTCFLLAVFNNNKTLHTVKTHTHKKISNNKDKKS